MTDTKIKNNVNGTNKQRVTRIEVRTTARGREVKPTVKVRRSVSMSNIAETSDVSLLDLGETTIEQGEVSRLINLGPSQEQPDQNGNNNNRQGLVIDNSQDTLKANECEMIIGEALMTSTQKESEAGLGLTLAGVGPDKGLIENDFSDENCPCEGCMEILGKGDNCAECDGCNKWFCQKCIVDNEKLTKRQITAYMKVIGMTQEFEGLFWFCNNCTEMVRKGQRTKGEKRDDEVNNNLCEGCKKGAIDKPSKIQEEINILHKTIDDQKQNIINMQKMITDEMKSAEKLRKEKKLIEETMKILKADCLSYKERLENSVAELADSKRTTGEQWSLLQDIRQQNKNLLLDCKDSSNKSC